MTGFIKRVAAQRISGDQPSPFRAAFAAGAIGAATAGVAYRLLRQ